MVSPAIGVFGWNNRLCLPLGELVAALPRHGRGRPSSLWLEQRMRMSPRQRDLSTHPDGSIGLAGAPQAASSRSTSPTRSFRWKGLESTEASLGASLSGLSAT